ncbi:MAG: ABC-2 type transport system ATP-binding protein [Chlamydiales bacterium]|jgi:ABC-2 type transport system ATP-binding protein
MNQPAVRLEGVTKQFGDHVAVRDLSVEVPKGSIYGFIGPNGSGKTTTLRMILHIFHPDSGLVEVLGERSTRASNDHVGYLPEERGLYKKMKVSQLLGYYGELKGMRPRDAARAAGEWLERLKIADWGPKKIEALSKGMAQKVQFISTVIARPKLLILDEPFSGLDPVNLEVLRDAILELRDEGATIIFSTHDMAMAEKMCDSIMMIFNGDKVLDGSLAQIRQQYGVDTVRLRMEGSSELLRGHPAVESVNDMGSYQEVRLSGDSQDLLASLVAKTRIHQFEIAQPSLHDIFVRIAGPAAEAQGEVQHV